ncbi:MAG: Eco57I restriction-modification methylase domain-containing protein [Candidatus Baldrarchaeia archaeon]
MSTNKSLNENEMEKFRKIVEDIEYLSSLEEINISDMDNVLSKLKSEEAKDYINYLLAGSKPETALREAFFAGGSVLGKYLYGFASPEVVENGFVDYLIKDQVGHVIVLELKSLFTSIKDRDKSGRKIVKKLKQQHLNWETHKEQIKNYINKGEYVILTNLKEWIFFSRSLNPRDPKPFYTTTLSDLIKDYEVIGNLKDYCDRKEFQARRYELDKEFLESLKEWVKKLSEVEFTVDERRKLELIIGLINKFIFIQTLDDYGVIEFKWIQKNWEHYNSAWISKGKLKVLEEFLKYVDNWFYEYYDTELFRENFLQYVKKDPKNIDILYRNLQMVLGLTYLQVPIEFKGIMQYNFRLIDEDVLGKAYETFLAEQRKEEGAFYTPKYITEYVVENTLGKLCDEILKEVEEAVKTEDLNKLEELVERLASIKVLDPACGSGSFLIKALRRLYHTYMKLAELMKGLKSKYDRWTSLLRPSEVEVKVERIKKLLEALTGDGKRDLISKVLVRHIHGNDLDRRALEVAKVNLWLEALKLAPQEFRFDRLPRDTNHILPDLEMNLCNGDSVVGMPESITIEFLAKRHKDDIVKLHALREKYLANPTNPELVKKIEKIKSELRKELNTEFEKYLKRRNLPVEIFDKIKPFHWALEFWYFYFDKNGEPLPEILRGVDVLIGNPPYERIQILNKKAPVYVQYLNNAGFESAFKNYDLAVIFIERGFKLLKQNGEFGYIVTHKFMQADYGEKLREFLSRGKYITQIVNFGDQQVFDDATTYTALLFLKKSENKKFKYALIKKLQRSLDQLLQVKKLDTYDDENITIFTQSSDSITKEPWVFALASEEELLEKLKTKTKLRDVRRRVFQGLVTGADPVFILQIIEERGNLIKVFSKSMNKKYLLEKDLLKPLLKGKDITKWTVRTTDEVILFPYVIKNGKAKLIDPQTFKRKYPRTWRYLLDNRKLLEEREEGKWRGVPNWYAYGRRQNLEQFEQPKIMTQVLASRSSFALDDVGVYYFVGGGNAGGYGIVLKHSKNLSLSFICGLLNSSLLDWNLKKISTRFRGGFYSYARRYLERLPIKIPETDKEKAIAKTIEKLVKRICNLKRVRYILLDIWYEWSTKLKNSEISLLDILIQDKENMQAGKFEKCWVSKVSFFPEDNQEIMNKQFYKFKVRGKVQVPILEIYGVNEDNEEELVYQIEFNEKNLMLHVYFSILRLLESRRKVKSLSDLLKKTMIPIIKPDAVKNTANIMKKVEMEFKKLLKGEKTLTYDLVAIDNEIEDIEAQIDAYVFKLYGLNEEEVKTVFDSLKVKPSYQQKVFEYLRKVNLND